MNLFTVGDFTLRSGKKSKYKIECDALTPEDWDGIAAAIMEQDILPPFHEVHGVPVGGIRLAQALTRYVSKDKISRDHCSYRYLVAEDVVTTGGSALEFAKRTFPEGDVWPYGYKVIGVCFIARWKCPQWITPFLRTGG